MLTVFTGAEIQSLIQNASLEDTEWYLNWIERFSKNKDFSNKQSDELFALKMIAEQRQREVISIL